MPANLTPEYFKAERWFRTAATSEEKILALERMLAVMPKHKGTDHLRADLRKKLSKLREAPKKKGAAKHADIFHIPATGAGQIVLLGTPNSGKSAIVAALTNAKVTVADYRFATKAPAPGMVRFEDVHIQIVDMPPIAEDFIMPGQVGTYRHCDLIAVVVDLSSEVRQQYATSFDFLESRNLLIDDNTSAQDHRGNVLGKGAFVIAAKADIAKPGALQTLKKLCKKRFQVVEVSTKTGIGLEELPAKFFNMLNIIRVYTKRPGMTADMNEPFTLPAGSTVMDLAAAIHRELAEKLKFARIWGTGVYDGQNTQRTHVLNDKDIIELHFA